MWTHSITDICHGCCKGRYQEQSGKEANVGKGKLEKKAVL